MTGIREMMCGTALLLDGIGTAKKIGAGWSVQSLIGPVFPSVRWDARPGAMTTIQLVATKAEARKALLVLAERN